MIRNTPNNTKLYLKQIQTKMGEKKEKRIETIEIHKREEEKQTRTSKHITNKNQQHIQTNIIIIYNFHNSHFILYIYTYIYIFLFFIFIYLGSLAVINFYLRSERLLNETLKREDQTRRLTRRISRRCTLPTRGPPRHE